MSGRGLGKHVFAFLIGLLVVVGWSGMAWPEDAAPDTAPAEPAKPDKTANDEFFFIGTANYHVDLAISEARINKQLNNTLGVVIPTWKKPTTFRDWTDEWRIWDLTMGYGRFFADNWAWSLHFGGGFGTIPNHAHYTPLGIPLKTTIRFTRRSLFLGGAVNYYPFGRPVYPENKEGNKLFNMLLAARPHVELLGGYSRQEQFADARFTFPFGLTVHKTESIYDSLFLVSPRASLEIPLSESNSFNMTYGRVYFSQHGSEFDGSLFVFYYRHCF